MSHLVVAAVVETDLIRLRQRRRDDHPVIGGLDAIRQFAPERLVVQIKVQVGEHRVGRFYVRDPGQRGGDIGNSVMRTPIAW